MAEGVVEPLEVIDVDHDDRDRFAIALAAVQLAIERILHVTPVVQSGEAVAQREHAERIAELEVCKRGTDSIGQCTQSPFRFNFGTLGNAVDGEREIQQPKHLSLALYRHADIALSRVVRVLAANGAFAVNEVWPT